MKPSAVVNNGAESDIAVQAYIEALLFDGGTNVENPIVSSAAEASQNLNQEPSLASSSDATAEQTASSNPVDSLPDAANSEHALSDPLAQGDPLKATPETSTESKSSAFLKQLEAAQRGGAGANRSALLAGAQRVDTRPLWGREDFSCLSFKVAGLKLAVPVEFVDGMQPLDLLPPVATLHIDAGDPSVAVNVNADSDESRSQNMILGRSKINRPEQDAEVVNVIDTARLVMPERYDPSMTESYRYILSLKNCDWSIAVDSIGGELALSPQNVRWRSEHTRREWLAGTVVDKMCALVDIDVLDRQIMADSILIESD